MKIVEGRFCKHCQPIVVRLREQLKKELEEARNVKGAPLRFMEVNAIIDYVFGVEGEK